MAYDPYDYWRRDHQGSGGSAPLWLTIGTGALLGAAAYAWWSGSQRNPVANRLPDDAPDRAARQSRYDGFAVVNRTVTINKPRAELYAFWRDFSNLPKFMENVLDVTKVDDVTHWKIAGPGGKQVDVRTRITEDRANEHIAWRSTDDSEIDTYGQVTFRDAPGNRGTEVEAVIAYDPPAGVLGEWIAKIFQAEPALQGRRELRRFKMLMEAGEVATNRNTKTAA